MHPHFFDSVESFFSANPFVSKHVFQIEGPRAAVAEVVLYKYPSFKDRTVICCSTQSGCPVGCSFCGAGNGFVRSLTTDEIVEQTVSTLNALNVDVEKISSLQIMFMSMGEPMLNQRHLLAALNELHIKYPSASLLISTSAPKVSFDLLFELAAKINKIGLQFSIHESSDAARDLLIPYKRKLSLQEIADVGTKWFTVTHRKAFINYCVHDGNSSVDDVKRLVALFDPKIFQATLSVICERDETLAAAHLRQSNNTQIFENRLRDAGFSTRLFDPAGQDDIGGGCGQLWVTQRWMAEHPEIVKKSAQTCVSVGKVPVVDGF